MKAITVPGALAELEQRIAQLEAENKVLRKKLMETVDLTNHHYQMIEGILEVLRELTK